MAGYRPTQIPKPASGTEFETNCVELFCRLLNDPNAHRLGTSTQAQDGVDIVGHRDSVADEIVGIQCKLKSGRSKLSAAEVRKEVKAALAYKPPLYLRR
jgi:Restriction endonuclease